MILQIATRMSISFSKKQKKKKKKQTKTKQNEKGGRDEGREDWQNSSYQCT